MALPFSLSSLDRTIVTAFRAMHTQSSSNCTADHLCVLVHGLWGNPCHMSYMATALREKFSEDKVHILVAKENSGSFTYDGVELGGERVTNEIEEKLEELSQRGTHIRKLSIIGYSLGGLVSRYTIGLLYHKGWFDKLEPVNFTTFVTPHLGVRTPLLGWHNHIWNVLGARTLSTSGRQLFMIDSFRDTGRPILALLADPSSVFIKGLEKFRHKSLYANIVNDRSAVFYTTGISRIDPFVNLKDVTINYVPGYEPVVIDGENPVTPKENHEELPAFTRRLAGSSRTVLGKVPIGLFLIIFIPIGTVLFLINCGVQSIRSRQRIRLHHEGKTALSPTMYSFPLMVDDVRRTAEGVFENINSTQSQEYLPAGTEELVTPHSPLLRPKTSRSLSGFATEKTSSSASGDGGSQDEIPKHQMEFPTLALTPTQFSMIQALDDVGFRKYPVYIHNSAHSHAAVIVRSQKKDFDEGKVVIKHWLNDFEA